MKKFLVYLGMSIFVLIFLFLIYLGFCKIKESSEIKKYTNTVTGFSKVDVQTVKSKIDNNESFFLYIGRSTCPWCRKLVPLLRESSIKQEINIVYLDSEDTQKNPELKEFRNSYGVKYVPSIIFFDKNKQYEKVKFDITSQDFNMNLLEEAMSAYIPKYKK